MSNLVVLMPIEFHNRRTGVISHGYTAYDDHGSGYCNLWDSIPDDDMEFLKKVVETCQDGNDQSTDAMLTFVWEHELELQIGETVYPYNEIADILNAMYPKDVCIDCGSENICEGTCVDCFSKDNPSE